MNPHLFVHCTRGLRWQLCLSVEITGDDSPSPTQPEFILEAPRGGRHKHKINILSRNPSFPIHQWTGNNQMTKHNLKQTSFTSVSVCRLDTRPVLGLSLQTIKFYLSLTVSTEVFQRSKAWNRCWRRKKETVEWKKKNLKSNVSSTMAEWKHAQGYLL